MPLDPSYTRLPFWQQRYCELADCTADLVSAAHAVLDEGISQRTLADLDRAKQAASELIVDATIMACESKRLLDELATRAGTDGKASPIRPEHH